MIGTRVATRRWILVGLLAAVGIAVTGSTLDATRRTICVVERDGEVLGAFRECSGIGSENEVVEFREGGDPEVVRKIPGRVIWTDVTLKRGITSNTAIWEWRQQVVNGEFAEAQADLTITLRSRLGGPIAVWHFANAWPSKVTGPTPKSDDNDITVEELTIVHEGMDRAS
jgi:phage tail-like protein